MSDAALHAVNAALDRITRALDHGRLRSALDALRVARHLPGFDIHPRTAEVQRSVERRCSRGPLLNVEPLPFLRSATPSRLCALPIPGEPLHALVSVGAHHAHLSLRSLHLDDAHPQRLSHPTTPAGFALDGRATRALVASRLGALHTLDVATGKLTTRVPFTSTPYALDLAPSGRLALVLDESGHVHAVDLERRTWVDLTPVHASYRCARLLDNGHRALLATSGWESVLELWDMDERTLQAALHGHHHPVLSLDVTPDARAAVTGGKDGLVVVWDLDACRPRRTLKGHATPVHGVAIDPTGTLLASIGADRAIRLWELSTGTCLQVIVSENAMPLAVALSPDARVLGVATSRGVYLWRLQWALEVRPGQRWDARVGGLLSLFCGAYPPRHNARHLPWRDEALDRLFMLLADAGLGHLEREGARLEIERRYRGIP